MDRPVSIVSRSEQQWRSQDLEMGAQGVWGTEVTSGVQGQIPWWMVRGGIASRKLIAVIKDI